MCKYIFDACRKRLFQLSPPEKLREYYRIMIVSFFSWIPSICLAINVGEEHGENCYPHARRVVPGPIDPSCKEKKFHLRLAARAESHGFPFLSPPRSNVVYSRLAVDPLISFANEKLTTDEFTRGAVSN